MMEAGLSQQELVLVDQYLCQTTLGLSKVEKEEVTLSSIHNPLQVHGFWA